jgi:hypothetical protein
VGENANYGYIYWPILEYNKYDVGVCISECPTDTERFPCRETEAFKSGGDQYSSSWSATTCIYEDYEYATKKYLDKFCLPDADAASEKAKTFLKGFYEKYGGDQISQWVNDLITVWWITLAAAGISFVLGFLYMVLLKWMAKCIIYVSIVMIFVLFLASAGLCYVQAGKMDDDDENKKYVTYGAYILFALTALYVIVMLCLCSRIRMAIAIFQVTADFMKATPSVFLVPIVFLLIAVVFLAIWIVSAIYIFTVGDAVPREELSTFANIEWNSTTRYVFLYFLFGLFWVSAFLIGCAQFIIAAACSTWYFSHNGDNEGSASLSQGIRWVFKFHLGSISFGALIIAIVQFIRAMFEYYRRFCLSNKLNENRVVKALLCVTSYLLWCLEKCVKFISKNAYIQIAIQGQNFCKAAWTAFGLIIANVLRFGAVTTLGCIFMFLGKLFIILATCLCCYGILSAAAPVPDTLSSPWFPLICCAIISY